MATLGLWYLMWDGQNFRNLMEYQGNTKMHDVQKKLQEIGISHIVILDTGTEAPHGEGRDIIYTGDPEDDAYALSEFLSDNIIMPYYVEIPFYKYRENCSSPSCTLADNRGLEYWKGWVRLFMKSSDPNLRGFYWNYESPMMFPVDAVGVSWETVISELASIIHRGNFEFIWIPYMHYTSESQIKKTRVFEKDSYEHHAAYYFDWVFLQPNYYQGRLLPAEISTLQTWKKHVDDAKRGLHNYKGINNIYYEFECDRAVLTSATYRERACDYNRVLGKPLWRAYYIGTDVKALEYLNRVCNYV